MPSSPRPRCTAWLTARAAGAARASARLALAAALGCGPASGGDAELWSPSRAEPSSNGGAGGGSAGGPTGSGGSAPAGPASGPATTGSGSSAGPSLTFRFTTVSFNGEYAPENVGAVWISDAQGGFVKTLALWATKRVEYLTAWRAASGDNVVDAVTGATRKAHGETTLVWDTTGVDGAAVGTGTYEVHVEFTERNGPGPELIIGFDTGAEPMIKTPTDNAYFAGQSLSYEP